MVELKPQEIDISRVGSGFGYLSLGLVDILFLFLFHCQNSPNKQARPS